jgi:2',3'-cyclic-nucleotide 2'-phosphodiesterase (5'-nucleotidase family)
MRLVPLVVVALVACRSPSPSAADAGPPPPKVAHVVILGNERGALVDRAPALAARLEQDAPGALVLSIGSTFSGAPLATTFEGAPVAEAMKALGVAGLTVSRTDLDFGAPALARLREGSGASLVLSTVRDRDGALGPSSTFMLFERNRVKVGVIGVAELGSADGPFEALPLEGALDSTVAMAETQGAQVVVVLAAGCSGPLKALLEAHPAWKVDLVVAKACPDTRDGRVGATTVLHLDGAHPALLRAEVGAVRSLAARLLDVPATPEAPAAAAVRARALTQLEARRQEVLGHARAEVPPADVARLVARALLEATTADAGLFVTRGVTAGLPAGALLRGHLLDAVPGEERVVLVDVPGEVLTKLVSHPGAVLALPQKVDPNGSYVLATTAFLYREGIGLEAVDANPVDANVLLGRLLADWLVAQGTSAERPLALPAAKPPSRRR